MRSIKLGAPPLNEVGAVDQINETFGKDDFPTLLRFTNLAAHRANFSELNGLDLEPCFNEDENFADVEVPSWDALVRVAASIEQVASNYGHAEFIEVSDIPDESDDELDDAIKTTRTTRKKRGRT